MAQELVRAIPGVRIGRQSLEGGVLFGRQANARWPLRIEGSRTHLVALIAEFPIAETFGCLACVSGQSVPLGHRRATGPSIFVDCFDFILSDSVTENAAFSETFARMA